MSSDTTTPSAPTITLDTQVQRNTDIVSADVDGEAVMMSIEQGNYYGANKMGTRIWELLEEPRQVSAICDQLIKDFEVDAETCHSDVLGYLAHLSDHKLVEVV